MRKLHLFSLLAILVVPFEVVPRASAAESADAQLVARVEKLAGKIVRNEAGEIVEIDLANRPTTNDDLKRLSAAPQLQKLVL